MRAVGRKHDVCSARAIWIDTFKRRPFAKVALEKDLLQDRRRGRDLPLNFHPARTRVLWVDTPIVAVGATDRCAKLSGGSARLQVAVSRFSANAFGVW